MNLTKGVVMYTGYFAMIKKYQQTEPDIIPVAITRFTPSWFKGPTYLPLAPSTDLLKRYKDNKVTIDQYIKEYNSYLYTLDPITTLCDLSVYGNLDKVVLCCYEKSGDFCHRHLLSRWLSNLIHIEEFFKVN